MDDDDDDVLLFYCCEIHHAQGNLKKKESIWRLQLQRVIVHDHLGGEHESTQTWSWSYS